VWNTYNTLIEAFGNEYKILLDAPSEEIARHAGSSVAANIGRLRLDAVNVVPGYDGVYGKAELVLEKKVQKVDG